MFTLVALLWRHPDLDHDAFIRHWRETHGPLMRNPALARHLVAYDQLPAAAPTTGLPGHADCDGVTVQTFPDTDSFFAFLSEPAYRDKVRPDEERLLDVTRTIWFAATARPVDLTPAAPA